MRTLRILAPVALATILLVACGGDDGGSDSSSAAAAPLDGTSWTLATVGGAVAKPGGLLTFEAGSVSGSTGCNNFAGTYEQDGGSLTITLGPLTAKACPGFEAQEQAVLDALPKTASFAQENGGLTLLDKSETALLGYTHLDATALAGPEWNVTGINNGKEAVVSTITGSTVTAMFGADGQVVGSAGCNQYSAQYTIDGATLTVGPPIATRVFCADPEGVMEQEAAFLKALESSTTIEAASGGFTLRDATGATQLTLSKPG